MAKDAATHANGTLVGRSAQLLHFAAKYRHLGGHSEHPVDHAEAAQFAADIQALGPAFIKIGQTLSTRPDLLAPEYLAALETLQDDTRPVPFAAIRKTVEEELGVRLHQAFPVYEEVPLAAASLAQVHAATLRDGRAVVVKVQRPGIAADIRADLGVLSHVARAADHLTEQGRRVLFGRWVTEMRETLAEELDYCGEADNLRIFAKHLQAYPNLYVPQPLPDFCSARVLTMERVEGTKVGVAVELRRRDEPLDEYARDLMRAYLEQIFVHGLVHADPHPGNVMLMPHGLALIDLGMVVRLGPRLRDGLLTLLGAAVEGDGDEVARQTMALGARLQFFDERIWSRRCGRLTARFATQSEHARYSAGILLIDLTLQSVATGLRPPPEIALLGRTLLALEGVMETLEPKASVRAIVRDPLRC